MSGGRSGGTCTRTRGTCVRKALFPCVGMKVRGMGLAPAMGVIGNRGMAAPGTPICVCSADNPFDSPGVRVSLGGKLPHVHRD